ncbi:PIG-L family deacetylase [Herminiimonas sp. KBW02]|uniref:PIG-L deacetylase family protein n=1 Tax=Herminiimonas sp. KBW02 TaxID=2153363 RepID=UPI000F5B80DA|nr:PIG-L family deacetylase [Herminiimonas sp. KBW02]RQO37271.1 PIG-L family deacetylase [Herminiimonas sp. KBW02]
MLQLPVQDPLQLAQMELPAPLTLVVLAPHPDDFDAIAVTLRYFHQRGDTIHLAVLTTGASGVEDGYADAYTADDKAALREKEQAASCAFFGLPPERLSFLRLPPDEKGNPRLDEANQLSIRDYLAARQPDLVFMPHGNDSNVTHQRTYALFRAVALGEQWTVWAVLNQDAKTVAMRTDLYTPFGADDATWKAELLRLHASQHQRNLNTRAQGFDERVLAVNRRTGQGLNAEYAEAFELERYAPEDESTGKN